MNLPQLLFGDTPLLADIVYPLLAGVCAAVMVLSISWYCLPSSARHRDRHPLHLCIAIVSGTLIIPALLASMATGVAPTYDIASVRNTLRWAWLLVTLSLFTVVIYYVRRFLLLVKLSDHMHRLNELLDITEAKSDKQQV